MERQLRGAILKALKEVGDISVGYLRVLLIYRGIVVQDRDYFLKEVLKLADKGYLELEKKAVAKGMEDSQRVRLTAKGHALVDGEVIDKEVEFEGV